MVQIPIDPDGSPALVPAPQRFATPPTLVYLYGPPASGKLTIAEKLQARTGFRLFHNHLTVNAIREVFDFASSPFTEVLHRLRLDVFRTAMRSGIDLIFTNNSAWVGDDGPQRFIKFTDHVADAVEGAGGRVLFVRLTAPREVLEARLDAESRRSHGKLLDATRLRELLDSSGEPVAARTAFALDTAKTSPDRAAEVIARAVLT